MLWTDAVLWTEINEGRVSLTIQGYRLELGFDLTTIFIDIYIRSLEDQ
jgi:hypothetical protein